MTESDLATLASRLEGANLSLPVTDYFARLVVVFGLQRDLRTSHRIKSVAFHRSRTRELPWFWPCDEIFPVAAALHRPSPRTVAVIFQFFEAVALIRQLLDGKSMAELAGRAKSQQYNEIQQAVIELSVGRHKAQVAPDLVELGTQEMKEPGSGRRKPILLTAKGRRLYRQIGNYCSSTRA